MNDAPANPGDGTSAKPAAGTAGKPAIDITYCTQCNWMLRSAYLAQELLSTFSLELAGVTLTPGTGGIFEIHLDGELVWERKRDGGFPDSRVLKQMVRDRIDPERSLGHVDTVKSS